MVWWKRFVVRNELDSSTGGGDGGSGSGGEAGGFDMASAVDSLGAELGFGSDPDADDGLGKGETVNEEVVERKPAPTPPPAPTAGPAVAPAAGPAPAPAATPAAAPASGAPARFTADAAPTTWTPAVAAKWATVDPEVRAEIAKRENDMFSGLEQYRAGATFAREVQSFLKPVEPLLAQHGVEPQRFLGNLVQGHMMLSDTSVPLAQRQELAANLLKSYGITLPTAAEGQPAGDAPYVDPEVVALRQRLDAVESSRQAEVNRAAMADRQQRAEAIKAFAEDPAHPHFHDVIDDMTILIRGSGGTMSLKDAYEKAVHANPLTRAKEVAKAEAAAVEKAQKEAQERATAARKATAANVKTSGHQGRGTAPSESMEDTMKDTLASIQKRDRK